MAEVNDSVTELVHLYVAKKFGKLKADGSASKFEIPL